MASFMQGTTPTLTLTFSTSDLLLSSVNAIELRMRNGKNMLTYSIDDLSISTTTNSVSRNFTESETASLDPSNKLVVQGRFWVGESIIGINKIFFDVADMMGVGADG